MNKYTKIIQEKARQINFSIEDIKKRDNLRRPGKVGLVLNKLIRDYQSAISDKSIKNLKENFTSDIYSLSAEFKNSERITVNRYIKIPELNDTIDRFYRSINRLHNPRSSSYLNKISELVESLWEYIMNNPIEQTNNEEDDNSKLIKIYITEVDFKDPDFKIDPNGIYNVDGNVRIRDHHIKDGKLIIKFSRVNGNFDCYRNNLTSLEGCPKSVVGYFNCSYNKLTSLKGGPEIVIDYFNCSGNQLTSLEGGPRSVGSYFNCSFNKLTSLEGAPKGVRGDFSCSGNKLISLEGSPEIVLGNFVCSANNLTLLEGCPKKVSKSFECSYNRLISLKGCPISIGGNFDCSRNNLTSLKGAPESVGGNFYCSDNKTKFSDDQILSISDVKGRIILDKYEK